MSTQPTNSGWTTGDKIGLASGVGSAILGAIGSSKSQKSNDRTAAAQQVIAALRNRQAAMAEQQALQQRQAEQYAQMNPLGAEQQYIQRQKTLQALLPLMGAQQIRAGDSSVAATQGDTGGILRALAANKGLGSTFSDEAIQRAILDRRNATTVVDPTIQRMPLGDYGFQSNNSYQKENDDLRNLILGRQQASRDAILGDANTELARAQQMEQQAQESGGGFWKTLGKIGLMAGGGLATAMSGGALSPVMASIIAGGAGAGAGAIDGGWKGAALGGGIGAAGAGLAGRFGPHLGGGGERQFANQMTEASLPAGMFGSNPQQLQSLGRDQWAQNIQNGGPLMGLNVDTTLPSALRINRTQPAGPPRGLMSGLGGSANAVAGAQAGNMLPTTREGMQRAANSGQVLSPQQLQQAFGPASGAYTDYYHPDPQQAIGGALLSAPMLLRLRGALASAPISGEAVAPVAAPAATARALPPMAGYRPPVLPRQMPNPRMASENELAQLMQKIGQFPNTSTGQSQAQTIAQQITQLSQGVPGRVTQQNPQLMQQILGELRKRATNPSWGVGMGVK
jgi:hypothetical protein